MKKSSKLRRSAWALAPLAMAVQLQAHAESSVTIYGLLDIAVDSVHKTQGNVQGTVFSGGGAPNSVASPALTVRRVSTSLSAQSNFGFRGVEDLGGGWAAKFQLESLIIPDSGTVGNDGRMWGRHAWVGLTTPVGEVRLGRQASPMLAGYYLNTLDHLGTTDLIGAGVTLNNLQIFQDNMLSYTVRNESWLAMASFSPNAGVASRVSAARSTATTSTPVATPTTGQIIGGGSAGAESDDGRGRTVGALVTYTQGGLKLIGAFHANKFGVPFGLVSGGNFVPLYNVDSYRAAMLGSKYAFGGGAGTELAFNVHMARFNMTGSENVNIRTFAFAIKQPVGDVSLIAQAVQTRFANFTQGKDTGLMFGADYALSKRTAIYMRAGEIKDDRGTTVNAAVTPLPIAGGPTTLLVPLGSTELPIFSGAGNNVDARTTLIGVGLRHAF